MQASPPGGAPTQDLIEISEIRDDVAVMKDGTLRAVLLVSSVNFALKSDDEQNAIVYAYQDFLNSLDFPINLVVTSRKIDLTGYIETIRSLRTKQKNDLMRLQVDEYINFIEKDLLKNSNIMTKTFLVVVPFSLQESRNESFTGKIVKGLKGGTSVRKMTDADFGHYRSQLFQRLEQVATGLKSIGLRVVLLKTQELLDLYYTMYNPSTSRNQHLRAPDELKIHETDTF